MPVFNPTSSAPPEAVNPQPTALAPTNRNIIVDSRYVPRTSLLSHVEGTPWAVDYYSQVVDKDTALSGQQVNQLGTNQQYRLIKQFELRVTTPLSGPQDEQSNSMALTGGSTVYPTLIPNVGDMLLGDIGDGRLGVLQVTKSQRMTVMKDTVHAIEYQWVAYATTDRLTDLNNKVVKTEVFVRDRMLQDKYPFVAPEDYTARQSLIQFYSELVPMYFASFWDNEFTTFTIPDQDSPTYDPFLVEAVLGVVLTTDSPLVLRTRKLNVDGDAALKAVSIWDVLMERSNIQLNRCFTRASTVYARAFDRLAYFESICQSGIAYVLYPVDPERSISPKKLLLSKALIAPIVRPDDSDNIANMLATQVLSGLDNVSGNSIQPDIPKAGLTDYYVFTQAFYDGVRDQQSKLENLVQDYLDRKTLDPFVLLKLAGNYPGWEPLDQFYYGPVLMLLIRAVVEDF